MDKINIHELKIETIIGCLAWERKVKQKVIFDLEIECDTKLAAVTDDLKNTLDYSQIIQTIITFAENSQFKLIEALAAQTAQLVLEKFNISHLNLTLTKLAALPHTKSVSVNIVRP